MESQLIAVAIIITLAAIYVLRIMKLSMTAKGCGSGCGKCESQAKAPERAGMISLAQVRENSGSN